MAIIGSNDRNSDLNSFVSRESEDDSVSGAVKIYICAYGDVDWQGKMDTPDLEIANRLKKDLQSFGQCWLRQHDDNFDDSESDDQWKVVTKKRIGKADVCVVIISTEAMTVRSRFQFEIKQVLGAASLNRICLVPVFLEEINRRSLSVSDEFFRCKPIDFNDYQSLFEELRDFLIYDNNIKNSEEELDPQQLFGRRREGRLKKKIYIGYAEEVEADRVVAEKLYQDLALAGFDPWIASEKVKLGQDRKKVGMKALLESDFMISLISKESIRRAGVHLSENRAGAKIVEDDQSNRIFLIPAILDDLAIENSVISELQVVNISGDENYYLGLSRIIRTLELENGEYSEVAFSDGIFLNVDPNSIDIAVRLHWDISRAGYKNWFGRTDLLPGSNIEKTERIACEKSCFFIDVRPKKPSKGLHNKLLKIGKKKSDKVFLVSGSTSAPRGSVPVFEGNYDLVLKYIFERLEKAGVSFG